MSFIHRYEYIIQKLRTWAISTNDISEALFYANLYGMVRAMNNDGTYSDDDLEKQLTLRVLATSAIDIQSIRANRGNGVAMIATELYDYGGHTKVLMTWLKLMKDDLPHRLIVTRALKANIEGQVKEMDVEVFKIASGSVAGVLEFIAAVKGCNRIVMHTHPEDILSAVSMRILSEAGYEIIFYNHADHLFSFGLSAANTVCEISSFGEAINQRSGRINGVTVRLGIPLKYTRNDSRPLSKETNLANVSKMLLTVGSSYKYKPDERFLFADFIDEILLRRLDVKVVLVGPTGQESWWVRRRGKWGHRVLFMGVLQHTEYVGLLEKADVYIDSYPVTGGTAFPEALLAGKACIGLTTPMQGYSLADGLRVSSVDDLVLLATGILEKNPTIMQNQNEFRSLVASMQSEDVFKARITEIYNHQIASSPPIDGMNEINTDSYILERKWLSESVYYLPLKLLLTYLPPIRSMWVLFLMFSNNFIYNKFKAAQ